MNLENSDNTFLTKGINLEEKLFLKHHLFRMGAYFKRRKHMKLMNLAFSYIIFAWNKIRLVTRTNLKRKRYLNWISTTPVVRTLA